MSFSLLSRLYCCSSEQEVTHPADILDGIPAALQVEFRQRDLYEVAVEVLLDVLGDGEDLVGIRVEFRFSHVAHRGVSDLDGILATVAGDVQRQIRRMELSRPRRHHGDKQPGS